MYTWRAKAINGVDVFLRPGRLVAREYAHLDPDREGLFSPASSAIATKLIPSCFMTQKGQGWSTLAFDVSDAYLTVDQGSPTVTSVRVDGQHLWFALDRCLPGQRDGSARWYQEFTRFLKDQADAELMPQLPALFRLPDKKGSGLIHVDDVLAAGLTSILERLASTVASKYKISVQWVKEPGDKLVFLKKVHTLISPLELVIEMPRKHIDRLEELRGLHKAKPRERKTAFPSGRLPTEVDNDPLLADDAASAFRTAVGILLYLQPDAAAAQHAIRYLASYMSKPSEGAWKLLRHVVGFLRQHAGYCLCFEVPEVGQGCKVFTPSQHCIELYTDADWSGNRLTRKSVSGSVIMVNKHVVFSASRTQKIIALSSAESEFHSAVSGSIDGLLIKAAVDYVYPGEASAVNVLVDNSAACAIAARQGVGRVRHIHAKMLWLQQRVSFGDLIMRPVETAINLADLQTKSLSPARTKFLLGLMNFKDGDEGYANVGHDQKALYDSGVAIKSVCKSLKTATKRDSSGDQAKFLSAVLCATQVQNALGQAEDDDGESTNASAELLKWILEQSLAIVLLGEICREYPLMVIIISQAGIFVCCCLFWRKHLRERSVIPDEAQQTPSVADENSGTRHAAGTDPPKPIRAKAKAKTAASQVPVVNEERPSSSEASASVTEAESVPVAAPVPARRRNRMTEPEVFVTRHRGYAFHLRRNCDGLRTASEVISTTRQIAIARGFVACRICAK